MSGDPGLYGRPTAIELVQAVRRFLEKDVVEATDSMVQLHVRIAANLLAVVEREATAQPGPGEEHRAGLARFGAEDDGALAALVRDGNLDDQREELLSFLRRMADLKVAVAQPRHLG